MKHGRIKPYTAIGVRRLTCVRCGMRGFSQWNVCADGGLHRPLCFECDVKLNLMVLKWMGDPQAHLKADRYRLKLSEAQP